MPDTNPVGLDEMRALLAREGVHPADAEVAAALPVVASLYEGAQQLEHLLMLEHEPATTFRLPDSPPGAASQ
ncbi:MAG: hypothetical protein EXR51_09380 [Dehalococcoidia bacterium]|nr:hypothetical protein [Dehalococcoidia bacterium]